MARTMTPSNGPMTDPQIDKVVGHYRDMLIKRRDEIGSSKAVQQVLGGDDYINEQVGVLRRWIARLHGTVVHVVRGINRSRLPEQVLADTGRKVHSNPAVVATMPRGTKPTARLHIFDVDKSKYTNGVLTCADLAEEYRQRGLRADVEALADYLKKNPAAVDEKWLACQWGDKDGNYCYAASGRWFGGRFVHVYRLVHDWLDFWSFAGVPQGSSASAV